LTTALTKLTSLDHAQKKLEILLEIILILTNESDFEGAIDVAKECEKLVGKKGPKEDKRKIKEAKNRIYPRIATQENNA
jgi:hypothetical protein